MKIKMLVVSGLAAFAGSGVFAGAASAEQTQGPTHGFVLCEPFEPAEEAYFADPSRTEQELREAWEAYVLQSCATLEVPASEADAAGRFIDACLAPHMPSFSKAEAEACVAGWVSQTGNAQRRHRAKRKARAKRHKAKQPHASVALASARS